MGQVGSDGNRGNGVDAISLCCGVLAGIIQMKALAWTIVITCWSLYGLVLLLTILHPPAQPSNPIDDFNDFFHHSTKHWGFSLLMLFIIIIYVVARAYTKEIKDEEKK